MITRFAQISLDDQKIEWPITLEGKHWSLYAVLSNPGQMPRGADEVWVMLTQVSDAEEAILAEADHDYGPLEYFLSRFSAWLRR